MGGYQSDHDRNLTDPHTLLLNPPYVITLSVFISPFSDTVATFETHALFFALLWDCLTASCSLLDTTSSWSLITIGGAIAGASVRQVDMVNNMVILINIVHYKWAGIQKSHHKCKN